MLSSPDIMKEFQSIFEKINGNIEKYRELSEEEIIPRIKRKRRG